MDGLNNKNTRSDWYDVLHPRTSPIFTRSRETHAERRRVWDQAFSPKAIREYLPRIPRQISTLEQVIAQFDAEPVIANDIMQWFAFDSMDEFAFNESLQRWNPVDSIA